MISDSIKSKVNKPKQLYLLKTNKKWFNHYCEYITHGKILHVGNGLGYASSLIKEKNPDIIPLDISIQEDTINKDEVVLYDGEKIPYNDQSFDVVLCDYVIHHTPNPELFMQELRRVVKSGGLLIVIEQTYENLFQKCKLVHNCKKQNNDSEQKVQIYWKSYFSRKSIRKAFELLGLQLLDTISEQRKSSFTEMFVLRKS